MMDLTKNTPSMFDKGVRQVKVELRWDGEYDADVYAFALGNNKKCPTEGHFCFFKQLNILGGAIKHSGDMRTGDTITGEEPDEFMVFDLSKMPADVQDIVVCLSIYNAPASGETFGMMSQFTATLITDNTKVAIIDLANNHGDNYGMEVLKISRANGNWAVTPLGDSEKADINAFYRRYL